MKDGRRQGGKTPIPNGTLFALPSPSFSAHCSIPHSLIPALAVGFPSLQSRLNSQQSVTNSHQALLSQLHTHLSTLSSSHTLTTSLRLLRAQQTHAALQSRLTALVAKSSALSPGRNSSVRREEEELRVELEGIQGETEGVKQRGNELWAGVGGLKARRREEEASGWGVADEEGLRRILEVRPFSSSSSARFLTFPPPSRRSSPLSNPASTTSPAP